jgi:hypothetical protein
MGAGAAYHGGEFRLKFHHTHNAFQLMNERGAQRWVKLMVETLDASVQIMTTDKRIRPRINTFLNMTEAAINALPKSVLKNALAERGVEVAEYPDKRSLVNKALSL